MRSWGQLILVIACATLLFVPMFAHSAPAPMARRAAPLTNTPRPNHPALKVAVVIQPVRTFERTALERDVRRLHGQFVVDSSWVSPREGHVALDKPTGRWHRAGAWRRSR